MSDDFGDFQPEQAQGGSPFGGDDGGEPIALPPPGDDGGNAFEGDELEQPQHDAPVDDAFGLSSPPAAAVSSQGESDPFATVDGGSQANAGAFDSFTNQPVEAKEEEAQALQKWEAERAQVLRARAEKAQADKAALLTGAKDEVSKFYADRAAQLAKQQKTNRADEKNYRADMKSTFESGQRWEKVNKLISTAPRAQDSKNAAAVPRVDRMRKLLIQLKAEKKQ